MAWVTQRTYTTGETITASMLNVMLRDDLRFLYSPPAARAQHNQSQALSQGQTEFIVDFDTTIFDSGPAMRGVDWAASTSRPATAFLTAPIAGRYLVGATLGFSPGGAVGLTVYLARSLSSRVLFASGTTAALSTSEGQYTGPVAIEACAAGDPLYVVFAAEGDTPTTDRPILSVTGVSPVFSAHWMGN